MLLAVVVSAAACSNDSTPGTPATCTPACRDGFTCVAGACVSACNPACSASEVCTVTSGIATCIATAPTDAGTDVTLADTSTTDVTQPSDVELPDATTDVAPSTDVAPVDGGRPPCGMTGLPCCNSVCVGNNVCNSTTMRCEAYTPEAGECVSSSMCPSGQVCTYGQVCSGGTRTCLKCMAPPMGLPAGAACGPTTMPCTTGVCANSVCTGTCAPGAAGDEACQRFNPQTVCSELAPTYQTVDGGRGPLATFGACIRACRRDADCASPARCGLAAQRIADTLIQTCRVPFERLAPGVACPTMPTSDTDPMQWCQSGQCIPDTNSATERMGHCSAFCATDADCPSALPHCVEFAFRRPSFPTTMATVPIRMCDR